MVSSGWAWPKHQAAKCPLRWVRDEVCSGVDMDGDLGIHCLLPLSPTFTSSVLSRYLHPVSSSCPGPQSAPPRGSWTPYFCSIRQKTRGQDSRGPACHIPAQPRLPCRFAQGVHCTKALPAGIIVHTVKRGQFVYLLGQFSGRRREKCLEKGILFLTDTKAPCGLAVPQPG